MRRKSWTVALAAILLTSGVLSMPRLAVSGFYAIPVKNPNCPPCPSCPPCPPPAEISVPKTGQTGCSYYQSGSWKWDATGTNAACPPGQDGVLKPGADWPAPRFTDNGDGTVTDNLTHLIWLKNANCPGGGKSWSDALNFAAALHNGDCGLSDSSSAGDWRIPTIYEMISLADYNYFLPALSNTDGTGKWTSGNPFNNVVTVQQASKYWTSTSHAAPKGGPGTNFADAWYVEMCTGNPCPDVKSAAWYVWPVRNPRP